MPSSRHDTGIGIRLHVLDVNLPIYRLRCPGRSREAKHDYVDSQRNGFGRGLAPSRELVWQAQARPTSVHGPLLLSVSPGAK
jgi:hypothetical protein